ncbi:MAG: response regulator [Pseudomonadota bacterium]
MPLASKRILLLEDEPIIAMLAEDLLRSLGASEIEREATLADAERAVNGPSFDAALVDVDLQGESSLSLAGELKRAGTPVVLASGYSHLTREAADDFIVIAKPFTLAKLKTAFLQAFEHADA